VSISRRGPLLLTGRREEEGGFRVSAGEETPHRERVEEERARGRPRGGNDLGFQLGRGGRSARLIWCRPRADRLSGPCPGRVTVLPSRPKHGHGAGPCLARARGRPCRAVFGSGFFVPCPCQPARFGPFGNL
jgi:hypothetical protein